MPFWWNRRKRFWRGRYYRKKFRRRYPRKQRRRVYKRRRTTKTNRRRRRRHRKVRRKRQAITVKQWQPDSIRNCRIKGSSAIVIGAEGTQMYCYTAEKDNYVPPKVPWGGGLGVENYTLNYLYEEFIFHNNIWTASNIGMDLCRYLRAKLTFFRHPYIDFVIAYSRQPPFNLSKYTYPSTHPHQLLQQKHHKIILSRDSKPNGKYFKRVYIKPPKQMLTKWFFTKNFCTQSLFLLQAAAVDFKHSYLSATNENRLISITSINTKFYQHSDWAQNRNKAYLPYTNAPLNMKYTIKTKTGSTVEKTMNVQDNYLSSVNYETGWFKSEFLQAYEIKTQSTHAATIPWLIARYNPNKDTGEGNTVFIKSVLSDGWNPPSTDKELEITNIPLWLALSGFLSYIKEKKNADYLKTSVVVIQSPAIHCSAQIGSCGKYVPIDLPFIQGKKPYEQIITQSQKEYWYPTTEWQLQTLNAIVESGPYIPKLSESRESTWELKYNYNFFFKWGGPQMPDKPVKDPEKLDTYDVPDTITQTIQITNPKKTATESYIHPWDIRRGQIKETALKRMCYYLETDTEFECSTEQIPSKKRKIMGAALRDTQKETQEMYNCLHGLCEKSTSPPQEAQTWEALIQQQQQQQQELKYNILRIISDIKAKQNLLRLQTGAIF
nr:MAG: ORF1 [Torque teno midi virus]